MNELLHRTMKARLIGEKSLEDLGKEMTDMGHNQPPDMTGTAKETTNV